MRNESVGGVGGGGEGEVEGGGAQFMSQRGLLGGGAHGGLMWSIRMVACA